MNLFTSGKERTALCFDKASKGGLHLLVKEAATELADGRAGTRKPVATEQES